MDNATQSGSRVALKFPDLHYFDKLPPTARAALANAAFDWSAGAVLNKFKRAEKGFRSGKEIAESVKQWDRNTIKRDKRKVWGRRWTRERWS